MNSYDTGDHTYGVPRGSNHRYGSVRIAIHTDKATCNNEESQQNYRL